MKTNTKQKIIPTMGVETSVKELSLEEQLVAKRQEDLIQYQEALKTAEEKWGYKLEPVVELSLSKGVQGGFNILPTR